MLQVPGQACLGGLAVMKRVGISVDALIHGYSVADGSGCVPSLEHTPGTRVYI